MDFHPIVDGDERAGRLINPPTSAARDYRRSDMLKNTNPMPPVSEPNRPRLKVMLVRFRLHRGVAGRRTDPESEPCFGFGCMNGKAAAIEQREDAAKLEGDQRSALIHL